MRIEVINVSTKTKEKTYYFIEINYKDQNGKVSARKLMSFKFPEVFELLANAVKGEYYEIGLKKEGAYWNWETAEKVDGSAVEVPAERVNTGKTKFSGGEWETREERNRRQVLIVRQNCISNAVAFVGSAGTIEEVINAASDFENWINRTTIKDLPSESLDDLVD